MTKYTVEDVTAMTILKYFPTLAVETSLSPTANLREDLKLTEDQIYSLARKMEQQYGFFDLQILGSVAEKWQTVSDIVATIISLIGDLSIVGA